MAWFRPNIERMQGYTPGEQPQEKGFIKLNTNESPYPPSPCVLKALRAAATNAVRLYPDPMANAVRRAAAETFGMPVSRILAGNGSDDLLTMLLRAAVGPGRTVAYPVPTYTLYRTLAQIENSKTREVPFPDDFRLPRGLFRKGDAATIIANPNSPTGTAVSNAELSRLARAVSGLLVVDEAYVDFADRHALRLVDRHPNVVVLRTFSKSFSLCGVRLGLAFAREEVIEGLAKVKDSYNVNRFAIAAGVAALEDIAWMCANAQRIRATRARLSRALAGMGWRVLPSQSNFLFARTPPDARYTAAEMYRALKARKLLVRFFDAPGLNDGLRITIGSDREIDALLRNMREIAEKAFMR
jgi:histidinol-phosphate aminotransferase